MVASILSLAACVHSRKRTGSAEPPHLPSYHSSCGRATPLILERKHGVHQCDTGFRGYAGSHGLRVPDLASASAPMPATRGRKRL